MPGNRSKNPAEVIIIKNPNIFNDCLNILSELFNKIFSFSESSIKSDLMILREFKPIPEMFLIVDAKGKRSVIIAKIKNTAYK